MRIFLVQASEQYESGSNEAVCSSYLKARRAVSKVRSYYLSEVAIYVMELDKVLAPLERGACVWDNVNGVNRQSYPRVPKAQKKIKKKSCKR